MLPTHINGAVRRPTLQQGSSMATYLRRIIKPRQMDLDYRHTSYHKQTKNVWARDDPAFVVICCGLVGMAAAAYCTTFSHAAWRSLMTIASAVLVDFLVVGWTICTAGWMYAFDVHCNSYFPLFILLYVVQFIASPLLLPRNFLSAALANVLYGVALSYYHYLNFLGYSALPFLQSTEVFLWPIGGVILAVPIAILTGFNPARFTLSIYFT